MNLDLIMKETFKALSKPPRSEDMSHTKGKATAEFWSDEKTNPSWVVKLGGKIRLQTLGRDDEAVAKEMTRRWNAFEEDGLVTLLEACKRGHKRLLEMGQKESHRTLKILKAAIDSAEEKVG